MRPNMTREEMRARYSPVVSAMIETIKRHEPLDYSEDTRLDTIVLEDIYFDDNSAVRVDFVVYNALGEFKYVQLGKLLL